MAERVLQAAVIGCRIGRLHASALAGLPQTELRWVCDVDRDLAARVGAECGAARVTADYREVLADEAVDLVTIALPHHLHFEFTRLALEAGKHVAVEKPLGNTLAEVDRLIALRHRSRGRIGVIFQNRFPAAARQFLGVVRDGTIGRIHLAHLSLKWFRAEGYYQVAPWRSRWSTAGGGVLTTQAIHYLDIMQAVTGVPTDIVARIATLGHDIEVEDAAVATGILPGGGLFVLGATTACFPEEPAYIQVIGSNGSACLSESRGEMAFAAATVAEPAARPPLLRALGQLKEGEPQEGIFPIQASDDGHRQFFDAFTRAILDGEPFEMDEAAARGSALFLDAIYASAKRAGIGVSDR